MRGRYSRPQAWRGERDRGRPAGRGEATKRELHPAAGGGARRVRERDPVVDPHAHGFGIGQPGGGPACVEPQSGAPECLERLSADRSGPLRLLPRAPRRPGRCRRGTGVVELIRTEADGDLHILVRLDAADRSMLTPANANERGDLVVEPVCVRLVSQADAVATCRAVPGPLRFTAPRRDAGLDRGPLRPRHRSRRLGRAPPALPLGAAQGEPVDGARAVIGIDPGRGPVRAVQQPHAGQPGRGGDGDRRHGSRGRLLDRGGLSVRPSTASGLRPKTASSAGAASWAWKVGSRTTPGSWPVTVTCVLGPTQASVTAYLVVT